MPDEDEEEDPFEPRPPFDIDHPREHAHYHGDLHHRCGDPRRKIFVGVNAIKKNEFVELAPEDLGGERGECPGKILLSTIQAHFPSATGLKFENDDGEWEDLATRGNEIEAPEDGWWGEEEVEEEGMEEEGASAADGTSATKDVDRGPGKRFYVITAQVGVAPPTVSGHPAHAIRLYDLEPEDILLHFNIMSSSRSYYHKLVQTGELKNLIQQRDWLIDKLACMRASGRSVDQKAILLSAGVFYLVHEGKRQLVSENINKLCKIPTDLFIAMNVVSNEEIVGNNFKDPENHSLVDIKSVVETNKFKKKKKKNKETPKAATVEAIANSMQVATLTDQSTRKRTCGAMSGDQVPQKRVRPDTVACITQGVGDMDVKGESSARVSPKEKKEIRCFLQQHKIVKSWYCDKNKTALDLLLLLTKFKNRYGWDHKLILQQTHFRFKGEGLPGGNKKSNKRDDQWEGGDSNLVISYFLKGVERVKQVDKYKKYMEQPDYKPYHEEGVEEIHSQLLSGIYVLEKSKVKDDETYDIKGKALRVAHLIRSLRRTPDPEHQFYRSSGSSCDFTRYYNVPSDCDEEGGPDYTIVLTDGEGDVFACDGVEQGNITEKTMEEKGKYLRFHLCREHLSPLLYKEVEIWDALQQDMPIHAFIRHVCYTASLGLFNNQNNVQNLTEKMKCPFILRNVHPFQVLKTVLEYKEGVKEVEGPHVQNPDGSYERVIYRRREWNVDTAIYNALCEGFAGTLKYCPRGLTDTFSNLKYKVCIEMSGPMLQSHFVANPKLSRARAAVAMSLGLKKFLPKTEIFMCCEQNDCLKKPGFKVDVQVCDIRYGRHPIPNSCTESEDLHTAVDRIRAKIQQIPQSLFKKKSELARPIIESIKNKEKVDAFVLFTLNDRNNIEGESPYEVFRRYQATLNPHAKLIICTMEAKSQIIADPKDPSVKVLCGADAYLLHEIIRFMHPDKSATQHLCKFCCADHGERVGPVPSENMEM